MDITELKKQIDTKFDQHRLPLDEIYTRFQTNPTQGLNNGEAKRRLDMYGSNVQQVEQLSAPAKIISQIKVLREKVMNEINPSLIVPGDIICLTKGNLIPADMRIIKSENFKVNISSLTGESEPQCRTSEYTSDNPLETKNLLFYPAFVTEGTCEAVVLRTGDKRMMADVLKLSSNIA